MRRRSPFLIIGLPAIAALALLGAVFSMANSSVEVLRIEQRFGPPLQPQISLRRSFIEQANFIGAAGLVEASSEEIRLGTDVSGTVQQVFVTPGTRVEEGAPVFVLDTRIAEAVLVQRHRDRAAAEARLEQARARVPGLEAELEVARTAVLAAGAERDEAADMVRIANRLEGGSAITEREMTRRRNGLRTADARHSEARARLAQAKANLALFTESEGGASIAVEQAAVEQAKAAIALAERDLELRTVRSPIAGTALQVNVRPGEYAEAGRMGDPLVIMGRIVPLHVRVNIDEADIPHWRPGAGATASLRGVADRTLRLTYVRREPLVVPKRALSGAATERVDTRVMQVIYEIEPANGTIHPGQQLDVFIEATDVELQARAQH